MNNLPGQNQARQSNTLGLQSALYIPQAPLFQEAITEGRLSSKVASQSTPTVEFVTNK